MSPLRRPLLFLAALSVGAAIWWYGAPILLFPVLRTIVESVIKPFTDEALSRIVSADGLWILNTQLLRVGSQVELLDLPLDPRHFTLALPLAWAFAAVIASSRQLVLVVVLTTLLVVVPMTLALSLQVLTSIPKLARISGSGEVMVIDALGRGVPRPYKAPASEVISFIDAVRVVLVYSNLFIFPFVASIWSAAWLRERAVSRGGSPARASPQRPEKRKLPVSPRTRQKRATRTRKAKTGRSRS